MLQRSTYVVATPTIKDVRNTEAESMIESEAKSELAAVSLLIEKDMHRGYQAFWIVFFRQVKELLNFTRPLVDYVEIFRMHQQK